MAGKAKTPVRTFIGYFLFVSAFLAVGIYCLWLAQDLSSGSRLLAAGGLDAQALITERVIEDRDPPSQKYGGAGQVLHHMISYSFADAEGVEHQARKEVSVGFYGTVTLGQTVPVRYLPGDPVLSEIEPGGVNEGSMRLTLLGLAIIGIITLLGGLEFYKVWQKRRAASV
jgi:hypothetical protein